MRRPGPARFSNCSKQSRILRDAAASDRTKTGDEQNLDVARLHGASSSICDESDSSAQEITRSDPKRIDQQLQVMSTNKILLKTLWSRYNVSLCVVNAAGAAAVRRKRRKISFPNFFRSKPLKSPKTAKEMFGKVWTPNRASIDRKGIFRTQNLAKPLFLRDPKDFPKFLWTPAYLNMPPVRRSILHSISTRQMNGRCLHRSSAHGYFDLCSWLGAKSNPISELRRMPRSKA